MIVTVNDRVISNILNSMMDVLEDAQFLKLKNVLNIHLGNCDIIEDTEESECTDLITTDNRNMMILEEFIRAKRLEGLSEQTLIAYRQQNSKLLAYLDKYVGNINTRDIRRYLSVWQESSKVCNNTVRNCIRYFSSFFNWLEDEDYIGKSPTRKLRKINVEKVIRKPFTEEDIIKLTEAASSTRHPIRNIAIIYFLNSTGCRVGELVKLRVEDIDFAEKTVIVFGKGKKERVVYINEIAMHYLLRYLMDEKTGMLRRSGPLFLSLTIPGAGVTIDAIQRIMKTIGAKAGVENVHPHRFRRTLACRLINRKVPIQEVMTILGHARIETTMLYCNIDSDNVKLDHKRYS